MPGATDTAVNEWGAQRGVAAMTTRLWFGSVAAIPLCGLVIGLSMAAAGVEPTDGGWVPVLLSWAGITAVLVGMFAFVPTQLVVCPDRLYWRTLWRRRSISAADVTAVVVRTSTQPGSPVFTVCAGRRKVRLSSRLAGGRRIPELSGAIDEFLATVYGRPLGAGPATAAGTGTSIPAATSDVDSAGPVSAWGPPVGFSASPSDRPADCGVPAMSALSSPAAGVRTAPPMVVCGPTRAHRWLRVATSVSIAVTGVVGLLKVLLLLVH
jgi:hypothetical protein